MEYNLHKTLLVFPQLNASVVHTGEVSSDVNADGRGIIVVIGI